MPAIQTARLNARQFLQLGEDPAGVRLELVDGEIEVAPSPAPRHSFTDNMLRTMLTNHAVEHDLGRIFGDIDTVVGEYDVRRPDILFFAKDRLHLVTERAIEGPPDLCVEIVSPTSGTIDRSVKFEQYAKAGVANYWIVDPHPRTLDAYALDAGGYKLVAQGRDDDTVHAPPFEALDLQLGTLWM